MPICCEMLFIVSFISQTSEVSDLSSRAQEHAMAAAVASADVRATKVVCSSSMIICACSFHAPLGRSDSSGNTNSCR